MITNPAAFRIIPALDHQSGAHTDKTTAINAGGISVGSGAMKTVGTLAFLLVCLSPLHSPAQATRPGGEYSAWCNGPSDSANYFPIGVWLQSPRNAPRYRAIGINLYVGLYRGPTEEQLAALEDAGMPVMCDQNDFALDNLDRKIIVGWLQQDEPDNAQRTPDRHYGPPVTPADLAATYQRLRKADPTRPILVNFGQGVAWDDWRGRGIRMDSPEDYPQYVEGGDILSFDVYPAASPLDQIAQKLWLVPFGVDRLREWSQDRKLVWNCIETTRINNPNASVTPQQVKSEVWMSIIHGSRGIIYFAHQFAPRFIEAGLLADAEMAQAVGKINIQIQSLAPVLNSPTIKDGAIAVSSAPDIPIDIMVKHHDAAIYIFAAAMRDGQTGATFSVPGQKGPATVTVLGEDRTIPARDGRWADPFGGFDVHLYQLADR
jgi:hypothetical protein